MASVGKSKYIREKVSPLCQIVLHVKNNSSLAQSESRSKITDLKEGEVAKVNKYVFLFLVNN